MIKQILIDTSAFYALMDRSDQYHNYAKNFWRVIWWRRRELNPRPKIVGNGFYILILKFEFYWESPSEWILSKIA